MAVRRFFDGAQVEIGSLPIDLATKVWIKISGVWKESITWIKVSGVWKRSTAFIKVSGDWK